MTIEEKDFRLEPINDCSTFFDLELLYTIKSKGKEPRNEFKTVAYGISLEHAIKKIAQYRVSCKHKDESISLLTYFNEFKTEISFLKDLCDI